MWEEGGQGRDGALGAHREAATATLSSCGPRHLTSVFQAGPGGGAPGRRASPSMHVLGAGAGFAGEPGQGERIPSGRGKETGIGPWGHFPCQTPARLPRITDYCERLRSSLGWVFTAGRAQALAPAA